MVRGTKTFGEKVTRRPCASSRTTRARAVSSARGVRRRSASESMLANLGGVCGGGAVDQPQRAPRVDAGGRDVVATLQRRHGGRLGRAGYGEDGLPGRVDGRQGQGEARV